MPSLPTAGQKPWDLNSWLLVGHDAAGNNLAAAADATKVDKDSVVVAATRILASKKLVGDTQPAFRFFGDGKLEWGVGGTTAVDTSLYRSAANEITISGGIVTTAAAASLVGTYFKPATATGYALGVIVTGEGNPRYLINVGGTHQWGPGSAGLDTNLYRNGAGVLKTDGGFYAAGSVYASQGVNTVGFVYNPSAGNIGGAAFYAAAIGETQASFRFSGRGGMEWGAGGSTATDAYLQRTNVGELTFDAGLISKGVGPAGGPQIALYYRPATAVGYALASKVGAEANSRFFIDYTGQMMWSAGATGMDVNLYRSAVNWLKTDYSMTIVGHLQLNSDWSTLFLGATGDASLNRAAAGQLGTPGQFQAGGFVANTSAAGAAGLYMSLLAADGYIMATRKGTDTNWRFLLTANGEHYFGPGGAAATDTTFYRSGVNSLRTDGDFYVGNNHVVGSNIYAGTGLVVDNNGVNAKMFFGTALDTCLYRSSADVLRTDDTFAITAGGVLALNNGTTGVQIEMGYSGSFRQFRHTISTFHDGGTTANNFMDFNMWTAADAPGSLPTTRVLRLSADQKLWIGNALDTSLYRSAAGQLTVGGTLIATVNVQASGNVLIGDLGSGNGGGLLMGGDASIFRGAAGVVKTNGAWAVAGGYGTAFPASPTDGQEFTLVDSITNPQYQWRFRYNNGQAALGYKWEFIGGASMIAEVATAESTSSTSYVDLATVGPQFTVPRSGIYEITLGFNWYGNNVACGAAVKLGAAATSVADGANAGAGENGAGAGNNITSASRVTASRTFRRTLTAGDVLKMQYRVPTVTTTFCDRVLSVIPIRLI